MAVAVKSGYSAAPSTVYSQPPPPQRQVTALKPLAPASAVSASYNIYPVSTSVQQPPTPISSYAPGSVFSSAAAATSYSGERDYALLAQPWCDGWLGERLWVRLVLFVSVDG